MAKPKDLPKDDHKDYVVGPALARIREALGITQEVAAQEVGVHKMTISEWERGNARVPAESLLKLLPLYGITFEELPVNDEKAEQLRQKVRRGTSSRVSEPRPPAYAGLSFSSPIEAQRSRLWLEGFLLDLAQSGADAGFLQRLETGVRAIAAMPSDEASSLDPRLERLPDSSAAFVPVQDEERRTATPRRAQGDRRRQ